MTLSTRRAGSTSSCVLADLFYKHAKAFFGAAEYVASESGSSASFALIVKFLC